MISLSHKGKVTTFEDSAVDNITAGWILPLLETTDASEIRFAQQIIKNKGVIVSDGSYKQDRSSAAFTTVPDKIIKGSLTIPGNKIDQSSYRAELGGILASIVYVNRTAEKFDISRGSCMMICDNKGALASSFGYKQINPRWKCYDLLCMIRFHLSNSSITWSHKHVKGHQDDSIAVHHLTLLSHQVTLWLIY